MPPQKNPGKRITACQFCRVKKAKCDGSRPCSNCVSHHETCTYPEPRSRKRKDREQEVDDRMARMEALLRAVTETQSESIHEERPIDTSQNVFTTLPSSQDLQWRGAMNRGVEAQAVAGHDIPQHEPIPAANIQSPTTHHDISHTQEMTAEINMEAPSQRKESLPAEISDNFLHRQSDASGPIQFMEPYYCDDENVDNAHISLESSTRTIFPCEPIHHTLATPATTASASETFETHPNESDNSYDSFERFDPYLSVGPTPAVEWVCRQIASSELAGSSRHLELNVKFQDPSMRQAPSPTLAEEPDFEKAVLWTNAYFDSCQSSIFEVVDRNGFEERLRAHFHTDPHSSSDRPWYALRNAVYALGCWSSESKDSSAKAFSEARTQSWKYFQNAISVHIHLLHLRPDLSAIQALLLMAFCAEILGSPGLEYMLASSAVRLAQSMSLHLEISDRRKTHMDDKSPQRRLWWTLYAYDKHLACRSGRPSAIDDDFISCPTPTSHESESASDDLRFISKMVQHAYISSDIAKRLNGAKALKETPDAIMQHIEDLEANLVSWRQSLDSEEKALMPFQPTEIRQGKQTFRQLFLQFSYHTSMITIHGMFCYPWVRPSMKDAKTPEICAQIQRSTDIVGESSRQIILGLQQLQTTAALPLWLTFYYPLVGLVNLFICVLKNPQHSSIAGDVSLMDMVAGHFGYQEFVSSSTIVFPFPRQVTSIARHLIDKAKRMPPQEELWSHANDITSAINLDGMVNMATSNWAFPMPLGPFPTETSNMDNIFPGFEDWCSFVMP